MVIKRLFKLLLNDLNGYLNGYCYFFNGYLDGHSYDSPWFLAGFNRETLR